MLWKRLGSEAASNSEFGCTAFAEQEFFSDSSGILFFFTFRKECNSFAVLNKHCKYMPSVICWMWI